MLNVGSKPSRVTAFLNLFGRKSKKKTAQQPPVQQQPPLVQKPVEKRVEPLQPKLEPEVVSKERAEFLEKLRKLTETFGKIDLRVQKLTSPTVPVTVALQAASVAKTNAAKAGEAKPANWPAADQALDAAQLKLDAVNTACLDEAGKLAVKFSERYVAKDKDKPVGKGVVAKYQAYGKARKTLDTAISGKDGLAAMEACPAVETALAEFEAAASPSASAKLKTAQDAFDELKNLSDEDLGKKSLTEQAELAMALCANGTPRGSTPVPNTNPVKYLPTPGTSLEQLCRLYNKSAPDPKFMEKRKEQREKIVDEVVKMDEIKKLYKADGELDAEYWEEFTKDSDKALALMRKICNAQTAALGMDQIEVFKDPAIPVKNGNMGGYNPATNKIGLNFFPGYLKPVREAIDTIIHETFHAHQDVIVKKLKAGEIGPDDDEYATALMYMVNDIPVGYVQGSSVGNANYKTQPTEFDSYHHAGEAAGSVLTKAQTAAKGGV